MSMKSLRSILSVKPIASHNLVWQSSPRSRVQQSKFSHCTKSLRFPDSAHHWQRGGGGGKGLTPIMVPAKFPPTCLGSLGSWGRELLPGQPSLSDVCTTFQPIAQSATTQRLLEFALPILTARVPPDNDASPPLGP